jgi:GT2 family glycosyltransferase
VEWWGRGIRVRHHGAPVSSLPGEPFAADWLFGMGTYVPVEVFDRVGLPDAVRFPMAWGDLDFSLRAKRAGIAVLVAPAARLFHEVGDYDARVAGAPSARQYAGWLADDKHNLSLSAHAEIWKRHGPKLLWPLSLAMRIGFLFLNFIRIKLKFPREKRPSGGDRGFSHP